jgi:hypothetical protein
VRVRGLALAPHVRRSALRLACASSLVVGITIAAGARADDWLVALADRGPERTGPPRLALIYPQTELPALLGAGETLLVRLQLPAALTPPPGVQQERALRGFSAELIGAGIELGGAHSLRYVLPIVAIRPDAGTTLLYRVRLDLPAYAAPGTYGIVLHTPFGERRAERSVRVLSAGTPPRIARCPPPSAANAAGSANTGASTVATVGGSTGASAVANASSVADASARRGASVSADASAGISAGLASLPIDLWVCPNPAGLPARDDLLGLPLQPALAPDGPALALRVGRELWLRGSASELRALEPALQAAEQSEHLTRTAAGSWPLMAAELGAPGLKIERTVDRLAIDNRGSQLERLIPLLLPASASLHGNTDDLAVFPASRLMVSQMRSVVGLLRVAAGSRAALTLGPAVAHAHRIHLRADRIESGRLGRVRVLEAPVGARIAFEYGTTGSAFLQPELRVSLGGPLEQPVRALVMPRAGGAELVRTRLNVEPHRPPSCDTQPGRFLASPAALLLFAGMVLLKRRSRVGFGNRLGPP